jgi:hypothetical protein
MRGRASHPKDSEARGHPPPDTGTGQSETTVGPIVMPKAMKRNERTAAVTAPVKSALHSVSLSVSLAVASRRSYGFRDLRECFPPGSMQTNNDHHPTIRLMRSELRYPCR